MHVNTESGVGTVDYSSKYDLGLGVIDWGSLLEKSVDITGSILKSRYGVPPLGTSIYQRLPTGETTQVIRSPFLAGAGVVPTQVDTNTMLLLGFGLVALLMLSR